MKIKNRLNFAVLKRHSRFYLVKINKRISIDRSNSYIVIEIPYTPPTTIPSYIIAHTTRIDTPNLPLSTIPSSTHSHTISYPTVLSIKIHLNSFIQHLLHTHLSNGKYVFSVTNTFSDFIFLRTTLPLFFLLTRIHRTKKPNTSPNFDVILLVVK